MQQLQNHCALADIAQLRCSDQMSTSQPRTDNQLEVSFFGGVSGKNVKVVIPLIYPNLSKGFIEGYHDIIWGLREVDFRSKIFDFDALKHAFTNFALKVVKALADKEGKTACFIDQINRLGNFPTSPKTAKNDLSEALLKISEGTVTKSGVTKDQLTKTTPEKLSQPRVYKQLSQSTLLEREITALAREGSEDVKRNIDFGNKGNE
jgi:hypothetical protein